MTLRRLGASVGWAVLGGAAVLAMDLRPQPLEMWVLTAGVVTMAAAFVCWWGARREAERRDALKAMLGLECGGAAPGSSMSDLAAAVIARLARAEAAFAALEHQHLQVLDASIALQAERRRYLRADRGRAASDVLLAAVVRDLPAGCCSSPAPSGGARRCGPRSRRCRSSRATSAS